MKRITIEVKTDPYTGECGMYLPHMRQMDSAPTAVFDGYNLAHDLLDHQNGAKAIGSLHDEIEAIGACYFIRGDVGSVRLEQFEDSAILLGRDFANLCLLHQRGVPLRTNINYTAPLSDDNEEAFDRVIGAGLGFYKAWRDGENIEYTDFQKLRHFRKQFKHLLRSGWRKAHRRFKGDGYLAFDQFWSVVRAVDNYGPELFEGAQYTLSYGKGDATFDRKMYEYY